MTTSREVRRLVQPLLERNPDLGLAGRLLVVKPVHHFVRGIFIDRTSLADRFRPHWMICHLYNYTRRIHLSWGAEVYAKPVNRWSMSDPDASTSLRDLIESEVLPILRPINTLDGYASVILDRFKGHHHQLGSTDRVILDLALGNPQSMTDAVATLRRTIGYLREPKKPNEFEIAEAERLEQLSQFLGAKRSDQALKLLHEWEHALVTDRKLQPYWQPTPFPAEIGV